jgi:glutamate-1-semialdehyde 2,1-aminomutase
MQHEKSRQLYERARRVLAGGVASEFRKSAQPLFYESGHGSHITDVDGNEYLDFTLSQGPLILGHSPAPVLKAVQEYSERGQLFAGQHIQELELAEKLNQLIPCAELMRFSLSGSEADHAALRLARAATGRDKFLRFEGHYHGWFDNVAVGIGGTASELGARENPNKVRWTKGLPQRIEEEMIVLPWNDLELLEKTVAAHKDEIAAIITEGVMCNNGCIPPRPGFLEGVRALCDKYGIVFILDEVITGFRLGMGGAQQYFGVTPDLAIFGKAMANGYPISVLCGRRKLSNGQPLMELIENSQVIHAGTMNSNNPCVAAALATVRELEAENVHARLFTLGRSLMDKLREAAREANQPLLVQGLGPMFHTGFTSLPAVHDYRDTLSYDKAKLAQFAGGLHERGLRVIGRGLWYISAAHTEADIDRAAATAKEVLKSL